MCWPYVYTIQCPSPLNWNNNGQSKTGVCAFERIVLSQCLRLWHFLSSVTLYVAHGHTSSRARWMMFGLAFYQLPYFMLLQNEGYCMTL